jgi:hypothetical protein
VIAALLVLGAITLVLTNYKQVHEIDIFAFVLVVQSLPFLAAVALAAIEDTRFNSFVYWRGIEAKAAVLWPQRQAMSNVMTEVITEVMAEPPKLPADNIETAQ